MSTFRLIAGMVFVMSLWQPLCHGEEILFEDTFDKVLSSRWEAVGLARDDYRIRDGGLEIRIQESGSSKKTPLLQVHLPFKTEDSVTATVDVSVVDQPLHRNEFAGLCLLEEGSPSFTVRKVNIDGYFLLAPGEVGFIGNKGEEGDPGKYTVKYWPADKAAGPLRILVHRHYAYFQTGPSTDGNYKTYFHSAIHPKEKGLGFGLTATGGSERSERWVRFDNFRVTRN